MTKSKNRQFAELARSGAKDFGANQILYANLYANEAALPSASTYHGMFAHVHGTARAYYSHAGNWIKLVEEDSSGNVSVSGNITVSGTVDGRDVATDGTKLDGIEASATADQTSAEIRTLVEAATDSTVFTDADHTKLNGIAASADVTSITVSDGTNSTARTAGSTITFASVGNETTVAESSGTITIGLPSDVTVSNDLTVAGNLVVSGSTTQTGAIITDNNFTGLTNANTGNATDFGFYGKYVESSTTKYAGLYYDASTDNTFNLFCDTQTVPASTVNTSATGYAAANLSINNLLVSGTVDGRDVAADGTKLDGIEAGATADQTKADIDALNINADQLDGQEGTHYLNYNNFTNTPSIPSAANNATITLSAGTGLSGGGDFTTNQSSAETITFNLEAPYTYIDTATANYGTIKVDDDRGVGWAGYGIRDDWTLMSDGANNCGIYNDTDNEWSVLCRRNAEVELYHNGTEKFFTKSDGAATIGTHQATSFITSGVTISATEVAAATIDCTSVEIGGEVILQESTDRADLLQITSSTSGWAGLQIRNSSNEGRWSFMTDGSYAGIYDDENNEWCQRWYENSDVVLYQNNYEKFSTKSYGIYITGSIVATSNITAYSDEKLKDNIEPIKDPIQKVKAIQGVTFNRNDLEDRPRQTGVIAQQVEKVLPEVVNTVKDRDENETKTVSYGNMVGLLIEAIKEQQKQIDELKDRLA